jgi:hypothetical protein
MVVCHYRRRKSDKSDKFVWRSMIARRQSETKETNIDDKNESLWFTFFQPPRISTVPLLGDTEDRHQKELKNMILHLNKTPTHNSRQMTPEIKKLGLLKIPIWHTVQIFHHATSDYSDSSRGNWRESTTEATNKYWVWFWRFCLKSENVFYFSMWIGSKG